MKFEWRRFLTLAYLGVLAATSCSGNSGQPVAGIATGPTPVPTATPVATPTPVVTPTPVATATPTPVATATPTPVVTATPTPIVSATPTPVAGGVVIAPSSLSLLGTGAANAQSVTVSQSNYGGAFTFSTAAAGSANSCSGIASEAGSGPVYTITPDGNGHCTFVVAGGGGQTSTLTIDVTVSTVGGN
jgi:hypothetical protein